MANDIDKTSPHFKGEFGSIYEVNQKFPNGGVAGDYVEIDGWAHYWNADRGTWCVNAQRDSYWDELITGIIEKFKLFKGATYMGVAGLDTVPAKAIGAKMYYFATVAGTYKNFGGLVVPQGINVLYSENGSSWACSTLLEVAQELGVSTRNVVSQKVVNDALNLKANQSSVNEALAKKADKEEMNRLLATKANQSSVNEALAKKADKEEMNRLLATKANNADVDSKMQTEQTRVNEELDKKFDKESVANESGDSAELVMSQKAVSDKLSDLSSTMLYGGEKKVVESSVFSPNSSLALSTPISLEKVGDYVEIKAKVEGQGTLLINSDFPSNKPTIRYQYFNNTTDKVQLYVYMNGETAVLSSKFVSDAVLDVNKEHTIKVLLSSKMGNICTFDIYIDNIKAEAAKGFANPISDGTQTEFNSVGFTYNTYTFDKKCIINYIKYVSNGASEVLLQGLSMKGTVKGTVTENINKIKYKSTKEVEEKLLEVDKNVGKIEEEFQSTNEKIDKIVENKYKIQELNSEDSRVTITEDYVIPADGKPISSNGYNLFTFVAEIDFNIWFTDKQKKTFPSFLAISTERTDGTYTERKRYIANTEDNLPSESGPLSLKKGEKLYISTKTNEFSLAKVVSWMVSYQNGEELNGNLPLSIKHIEQVIDASNSMWIKKDATSLIVFFANKKGSYIAYPLKKRYKDFQEGVYPSFLDNWGLEDVSEYTLNNGIMNKKAQLYQNGEAELAINLPRVDTEEDTYVGGNAHGFENIVNENNGREFVILVDNVKVNENDVFSLKSCSKVEVYQHSKLYQAYSNSNPFADVTKKWVFYEGKVSITTTVKMLRDMSIRQAQFGMMCVYRRLNGKSGETYLTNKAIKDTMPYQTFIIEDNWNVPELRSMDHDACRVIEFGDYGLGFIMEIENDNRKANGGMFVHNNGTSAYNKIYFDLTGDYQANKGEILKATQTWSIR